MTSTETTVPAISPEERAQLDAQPVEAEVDADPAVAELEARIAAGDDEVTAEQLAAERTAAAGRVRFGWLRALYDANVARQLAEQVELDRAAAAEQHAREALAPYTPAALVEKYDAAVAGLRAYADAIEERNAVVRGLVTLPREQRHRGVHIPHAYEPTVGEVPVDGHTYRLQEFGAHMRRVLAAAGVVLHRERMVRATGTVFDGGLDRSDPTVIAEGRALLAERE